MAYNKIGVLASAARTSNGNSGAISGETGDFIGIQVDVTAASGTAPTLLIGLQWSMDGVAWAVTDPTAEVFTSITGTTSLVRNFSVKAPQYRVIYTIAGTTPSFTFSVSSWETT